MTWRDDLLGVERFRFDHPVLWATPAEVGDEPAFRAPYAAVVKTVRYVPKTAITGHAANFASLFLINKGLAGAGAVVVASFVFDTPTTDDVAAFDEKDLTLSSTASELLLAAGDILSVAKTVDGDGIALDGTTILEIAKTGP